MSLCDKLFLVSCVISAIVVTEKGSIHAHKTLPGRQYLVDDSRGVGRRFDGIGAISGGGVSSISLILVFNLL